MELKQYASILWRWKWLIVAGTLLAGLSAFVTSRLQTPVYQATTTVLVNEAPNDKDTDYTAILTSERLARTYAQMLSSRPVLEEVIRRAELGTTPEALAGAIDVQLVRDTQLITVSAEHARPDIAAEIANHVAAVFSEQNEALQSSRYAASKDSLKQELDALAEQVRAGEEAVAAIGSPREEIEESELARLQSDLAQYRQSYASLLQSYEALRIAEAGSVSNVVQVEAAVAPQDPIRPRTMVNTLLAAIVGAMLAVGMVFLIEYLDDTIKTPDEAARALDLPVIGLIARIEAQTEGEPHSATEPRSPVAEAFRALRTNLQFSAVDRTLHTLLITSIGPKEGKSTVAANLATVMAQGGHRVILVDADLRRPRMHRLLGVPNRVGLSDLFVRNPLEINGAARPWRIENLSLLTSGGLPPNPAELLASEKLGMIFDEVKKKYEYVVIDSPPASVVTDATILAARVDGVILVVEPKRTRLAAAVQVVSQMRRAGANVAGLVVNNIRPGHTGYYSSYYIKYTYEEEPLENGEIRRRRVKAKKQVRPQAVAGVGSSK
jgi:non-specific protein-tyrosine kinase